MGQFKFRLTNYIFLILLKGSPKKYLFRIQFITQILIGGNKIHQCERNQIEKSENQIAQTIFNC